MEGKPLLSITLIIGIIIQVQCSTYINILGQDYEMNVAKTYDGEPPNSIEIKSPTKTVLFIKSLAFNIGAEFSPLRRENIKPTVKFIFTDRWGNYLENKSGRTTFGVQSTREIWPVSTGDGTFTFQFHGDYPRNRVFLISSRTKEEARGKVFAFDTKELKISNGKVVTQEITELGDKITAITVQPSTGNILLSQYADQKKFNLITLTAISKEQREKLTGEVEEKVTEKTKDTVPDKVPETVAERVTEKAKDRVPDKVPETVTERVAERVTEKAKDRVPDKMPERVTERVAERVTEKVTEKPTTENVPLEKLYIQIFGPTEKKPLQELVTTAPEIPEVVPVELEEIDSGDKPKEKDPIYLVSEQEYYAAVKRAQDKFIELQEKNMQSRINQLISENNALRNYAERMRRISNIRNPVIIEKANATPGAFDEQLREAIKDIGDELIRIYNTNVLGKDPNMSMGQKSDAEQCKKTLAMRNQQIERLTRQSAMRRDGTSFRTQTVKTLTPSEASFREITAEISYLCVVTDDFTELQKQLQQLKYLE